MEGLILRLYQRNRQQSRITILVSCTFAVLGFGLLARARAVRSRSTGPLASFRSSAVTWGSFVWSGSHLLRMNQGDQLFASYRAVLVAWADFKIDTSCDIRKWLRSDLNDVLWWLLSLREQLIDGHEHKRTHGYRHVQVRCVDAPMILEIRG